MKFFFLILASTFSYSKGSEDVFSHPGLMHNLDELEFVRKKLSTGEQPWESAWNKLKSSKWASLAYTPKPFYSVFRGNDGIEIIGASEMSDDSTAAYTHALQYCITGNRLNADKAIEILNAWSYTLESVSGHDARLLIGMDGVKFCNAAELIRHSDAKWITEDQLKFERMLRKVFYPIIMDFYPTANGNWDASMIQTMIAMGIFLDDRDMFYRAVDYFIGGDGNGAIDKYINYFGECQESGRDQLHVQMGLGFLGCACEMAWKQGIDLYSATNYRLLLGFEYTAKYNLGVDVPFEPYTSVEKRYHYKNISTKGRGVFRPIYERIVNHYRYRKGIDMPYCQKVLKETQPEGNHVQHMPWGTLFIKRSL